MKILMVDGAGFSPPYDFCLTRALRECGAEVRLEMPDAVRDEWENPDALPRPTPSGFRRLAGRMVKAGAHVGMLRRLARDVDDWQPDIVHVQWLPLPLVDLQFLRAIEGKAGLVHTMHNTSLFHGASPGMQGWGLTKSWSVFDRIIVHSEYSRRAAIASGASSEEQLAVIPHGPFEHYRQFADPSRRSDAPVTLLFAGAIKAYKGLDLLVEALPTLAQLTTPGAWRLVIAGHPSVAIAELQEQVRRLALQDHVVWNLRHQSERELGALLGASHVVLLPYREIDQSGVLLAAAGTARPVVATKVGAFPEMLEHEQHGLLVPPNDAKAFGEAIARMVNDAGLRARGEAAMQALATGTLRWSAIARTTLSLYENILHTR